MNRRARVCRLIVRAYPRWWRTRYGDEFSALLDDHGVSTRSVVDIALGALDARVSGDPSTSRETRGRAALAASLWTVAALTPTMAALARLADVRDIPRALAAADHQLSVWPWLALAGLAIAGIGVLCLVTAVMVAPSAIRAAWTERERIVVVPLTLIGIALLMFVAGLVALAFAAHGLTYAQRNGPGAIATRWQVALPAVLATWIIAIVIGTAGVSRLVRRALLSDPHTPPRLAALLGACTSAAIAGMVGWGTVILATTPHGLDTSTTVGWLVLLTIAALPQLRTLVLLRRYRQSPHVGSGA